MKIELLTEPKRHIIDSMTLFLFAAYRNLDSESGLGEAPGLARADSKTAVLLPHKMFKLPLMMLRRHTGL